MDPNNPLSSPSSPSPSSTSEPIAVNLQPTEPRAEENAYAIAEAMRKAMRDRIKPQGKTPEPSSAGSPKLRLEADAGSADAAAAVGANGQTGFSASATSPNMSLRRRLPGVSSPPYSTVTSPRIATATVPPGIARASPPSSGESEFTSRPPSASGSSSGSASRSGTCDDGGNPTSPPEGCADQQQPVSMTSSIRDHVFEGGLRYHAYHEGKYAFPNDETEQNRDDMKHTMTLMLCNGEYFYSPVGDVLERGGEVLDLGTGTGIWAMELGDRYPQSTFTGIDLSPIQPTFVPENVHFFVDDFEEEWIDPDDKYDFIHLRHTLHSVQDPDALLQRVYRHLKPGAYFEAQELLSVPSSDDGTLTDETPYALRDYLRFLAQGMHARAGCDVYGISALPKRLEAAGFTDIKTVVHKCPLGIWPRDAQLRSCGLFLRTAMMDGLRGISRRPLMALGWTPLQIEMFLVDVRRAIMDEGKHVYFPFHVVYARKPA
ncbi:hypothetical protein VTJ83DRAFT_5381 [Remersonia thermophila]|uniref:Methyltransferase domain-containing protein n=1 Tax=Remersonia thermophila TaxID=72144 RepID=A0ABR4D7L8_9PEZI